MNIGFIGKHGWMFDEEEAQKIIDDIMFKELCIMNFTIPDIAGTKDVTIVSDGIDSGITGMVYRTFEDHGLPTEGIIKKCNYNKNKVYPCNVINVVDNNCSEFERLVNKTNRIYKIGEPASEEEKMIARENKVEIFEYELKEKNIFTIIYKGLKQRVNRKVCKMFDIDCDVKRFAYFDI